MPLRYVAYGKGIGRYEVFSETLTRREHIGTVRRIRPTQWEAIAPDGTDLTRHRYSRSRTHAACILHAAYRRRGEA